MRPQGPITLDIENSLVPCCSSPHAISLPAQKQDHFSAQFHGLLIRDLDAIEIKCQHFDSAPDFGALELLIDLELPYRDRQALLIGVSTGGKTAIITVAPGCGAEGCADSGCTWPHPASAAAHTIVRPVMIIPLRIFLRPLSRWRRRR